MLVVTISSERYNLFSMESHFELEQGINLQAFVTRILADLQDVFDVHFVGATFSRRIAQHTGVRTALIVRDEEEKAYDVWLCEPDGHGDQLRWSSLTADLEAVFSLQQPTLLEKLEQSAADIINSRLWLLARRNLIIVPLVMAGRPYDASPPAFLALIDPPDSGYLQDSTLSEIAKLVVTYLDRASLRETVDRRIVEFAVVSDISRALSLTLNIQQIYSLLTGPIRQMLNVETISIGLIEPVTGDIAFVDQLMGPRFERIPPVRLKRGQGIAGWVAEHQEPVIINDAYSDQRFFSGVDRRSGFRTTSMICIPLQVEERTIGVLQAINRVSGNFKEHDLRLMQAIGGPLAAAIENANLHADVLAEKRRIETIFANMAEGLVTVNKEGLVTQANSAFYSLVVPPADNVLAYPLREIVHPRTGDIDEFVNRVLEMSGEIVQWVTDIHGDADRWIPVMISGARVEDESGTAGEGILVFSDLTQIREVERMRDDLFHGIVHELRTPLATILMYARLLRDGKANQPDKAERFLGVIERESDRLQRMVRQMLDLAKLDAREMQRSPVPVHLNSVFEEVVPPLADRALQKGLLFQQRIETDLPAVYGSEETYSMILKNLLENAIKFTPSGSVLVASWFEKGYVKIEVSDQGIGIPNEAMSNLFKRFYRTQTAVERGIAGTGLGLYMVKENLKNYNGEISVKSEIGKGTIFTVQIPAIEE